jgi:tetratricopeptide (TPR) repeat protein
MLNYPGRLICGRLFIFLSLCFLWLMAPETGAADEPKNVLPKTDQPQAAANQADKTINYRQQAVDLMKGDSLLARQWRERRSFPHLQQAMDLIEKGQLTQALNVYKAYLGIDPEHLAMQWDRLMLLNMLDDPSRTETAASALLEQIPGWGPALMLRANARKQLKWNEGAESDWKAALDDPRLLAEDRAMALSELLFSTYHRQDLSAALIWCDRLLACAPDVAEHHVFRAGLLEQLQRWQEAVDQWQKVLLMTTSNEIAGRAVLASATLHQKLQQDQAAFKILIDAREKGIFDSRAVPAKERKQFLLSLALLAEKEGSIAVAVHAYEKLLEDGLDVPGRMNLARLYTLCDQFKKVLPLLLNPSPIALHTKASLSQMLDLINLLAAQQKALAALILIQEALPAMQKLSLQDSLNEDTKLLRIQYLAAHADIARKNGQNEQAETTLKELLRLTGDYRHQMDYAARLLANSRIAPAIEILSVAATRVDLSSGDRAHAYAVLAEALTRDHRWADAARTWHQAYLLNHQPVHKLYSIDAFRKAGDLGSATAGLAQFPVEQLGAKEQLIFYETAGRIYWQAGAPDKSLAAWQKAVTLSPCSFYYYQISDILLAANRLQEAEAAVCQGLQLAPQDLAGLSRRAYIQKRLGNAAKAADLFEQMLQSGADDYQTYADLGFVYAGMSENDRARIRLKQALDKALDSDDADLLSSLRAQIAELDRRFELFLADSLHSVHDDGAGLLPPSKQWFNLGVGTLEAGYRPEGLGYRAGRTLTLFGRLLWPNQTGSLSPEADALQAGLGFRYKLFAGSNFLFSSEYLFGLGEEIGDQVLLHLSHSSTRLPLQPDVESSYGLAKYIPYRQFYTDAGWVSGDESYWFGTHETRLGTGFNAFKNTLLLPFGYLTANSMLRSTRDFFQVETGLGLSMRWQSAFDRYRGYRRETECLLHAGFIVYDSYDGEGVSALLGIRMSLF